MMVDGSTVVCKVSIRTMWMSAPQSSGTGQVASRGKTLKKHALLSTAAARDPPSTPVVKWRCEPEGLSNMRTTDTGGGTMMRKMHDDDYGRNRERRLFCEV